MNRIRRRILIAILCLALLVCSVDAGQGVAVYPANLTVEGSEYDHPVRTFILTAQQDISDLQFISTDLESSGGKVFPSDLIQATNLSSRMANGSLQKVSIRIDLPNATDPARYAGEVWFSSTNATTRIPVSVTVKDGFIVPLFILLLAVLASILIFTYEARGKKRDQILQELGVLNYHVTHDQDLGAEYGSRPNPFHSYLADRIDTINKKIQAGETDEADTLLQTTEKAWEKWNTQRFSWMNAFKNFQEFLAELNESEKTIQHDDCFPIDLVDDQRHIPFFTDLRDTLTAEYDKAPETEKPDLYLGTVTGHARKEAQYRNDFQDLRRLAVICDTKMDCDACNLDELWISFFRLTENDDLAAIEKRIRDTASTIKGCPDKMTVKMDLGGQRRETVEGFTVTRYPGPEGSVEEGSFWANFRLWLYNVGSFLITIVILVSIGFSQLYLQNPTFGSPGDYATLAIWGLLVGPFAEALVRKRGKSTFGAD